VYGYRARIGYCSPPLVTETFCYEFYKMAPPGVTVMITTLAVTSLTSAETGQQVNDSFSKSLLAAKAMARAGADLVVLGGNPINQSRGVETLDRLCSELSQEIGAKVFTSAHAQMHALKALGAKKVATVQPFTDELIAEHEQSMRNLGCESAGVISCGYTVETLGSVPGELALTLSRQIKSKHPEADTIHPSCAHWATAHAIEQIEQELKVNVMTSQQAILWKALRTAGIEDHVQGYGRLLREF
jgi:maleate cis-trans isomerase